MSPVGLSFGYVLHVILLTCEAIFLITLHASCYMVRHLISQVSIKNTDLVCTRYPPKIVQGSETILGLESIFDIFN